MNAWQLYSVWEHVDDVSRTMKRMLEHLKKRDDSEVMVVSPDLAKSWVTNAKRKRRKTIPILTIFLIRPTEKEF